MGIKRVACATVCALCATTAGAGECPDLAKFRSDEVINSYDVHKMTGFWYEQAYMDPAQVGSRCQTLNGTLIEDDGLDMAFRVDYGKIPFTIHEIYTPDENHTAGIYEKTVKMPGAQWLKLDTVVVDAALSDGDPQTYGTAILYSCTVKLGVVIPELVFMSKDQNISSDALDQMEATAQNLGVQWKSADLHRVDWSNPSSCR